MIRKALRYLAIKFKIVEKPPEKDAITTLTELIPIIFGAGIMVALVKQLGLQIGIPWYMKAWLKFKYYCRYARIVVIGY